MSASAALESDLIKFKENINIADTRTVINLTKEKLLNEQSDCNFKPFWCPSKFFSFLFYFSFELLTECK